MFWSEFEVILSVIDQFGVLGRDICFDVDGVLYGEEGLLVAEDADIYDFGCLIDQIF